MRNPGTDFHRREADEAHAQAIIARDAQNKRNASEWQRRANAAYAAGDVQLAVNLVEQADLETARLYDGVEKEHPLTRLMIEGSHD